MERMKFQLLAAALVAQATFGQTPASPSPSTEPILASRVASRANQWLLPYAKVGDFSGVVLIAQGERILFERAYGEADVEHRVPNPLGTRFRLASLSKTFTAAGIELLIKRGQLRLSDTLDRYIKGIPNGDKITIDHLLLHRSGVGRFAQLKQDCLSEEEWIEQLRKNQPSFVPGTSSSYSNEGYFLLAVILEKESGIPYASFLEQNIFGPLRMKDTGSACKELPSGNNATGYLPRGSVQDLLPVSINQAVSIGPGSIFSNARDLYRWLRAVDTNPEFRVDGLQYPYGWGKRNFSGRNLIEQSGIVEGFNAHMAIYPTEHLYCIVLSNIQSGFFNRIEKDLESVLFGGDLSSPPQVATFRARTNALVEYTGTYKSTTFPVAQILSVRGKDLYMQWADAPFLRPLVPTGKDSFFYRVEYARVEFDRETGQISRSTWRWPQGDPLTFEKVSESDAVGQPSR
jgi:CubicO group peptidase (beta-lactamase class C family)